MVQSEWVAFAVPNANTSVIRSSVPIIKVQCVAVCGVVCLEDCDVAVRLETVDGGQKGRQLVG